MTKWLPYLLLLVVLSLTGCGSTGGGSDTPTPDPDPQPPTPNAYELLQVSGNEIIASDNSVVQFKGFCLTNGVYTVLDPASTEWDQFKLVTADYTTIAGTSANCVRFYMQYYWLSTDAKKIAFFNYLDGQIKMANANNLYIILNLHYFGLSGDSNQDHFYSGDLHNNGYNLQTFWKAISDRYKNEPQIAGYDLINEPNCRTGWTETNLYTAYHNLITMLRTNNDEHILIVADPVTKFSNHSTSYQNLSGAFQKQSDTNIIYTYHWYAPSQFTMQSQFDINSMELGTAYPYTDYSDCEYVGGDYSNPSVQGNTSWTQYQSTWANHATMTSANYFTISLMAGGCNGKVWFDSIELRKKPAGFGGPITSITIPNPTITAPTVYHGWTLGELAASTTPSFWYYASDGGSSGVTAKWDLSENYFGSNSGSLLIDGTSATWSGSKWARWNTIGNRTTLFPIEADYEYQATAYYLMDNNSIASISLAIEYYNCSPVLVNKAYLQNAIDSYYTTWANTNDVPLYCGEFGATNPANLVQAGYTSPANAPTDQVQWVTDMVDILQGQNWTYHCYKNFSDRADLTFGLYDVGMENIGLQNVLF